MSFKPMKPCISYYGGKQRMAPKIIPLIPKHTVYVEPFCGGATILFKKPWPNVTNSHHYREVINDKDQNLINFYRQLRDNGDELVRQLQLTPYSEHEHRLSKTLDCDDDLERARRYFINIQQSFSNVLNSGWGRGKYGRDFPYTWYSKVKHLHQYVERVFSVNIACGDALKVIKDWDSPQTFFYCDPPYSNSDQGPYKGYSEEDFQNLINTLNKSKGSFLLSCYNGHNCEVPQDWEKYEFNSKVTASIDKTSDKNRVEVVYKRLNTEPVRSEIQKLYDSGKYDCFTG